MPRLVRRCFIGLCVEGALVGMCGCVPAGRSPRRAAPSEPDAGAGTGGGGAGGGEADYPPLDAESATEPLREDASAGAADVDAVDRGRPDAGADAGSKPDANGSDADPLDAGVALDGDTADAAPPCTDFVEIYDTHAQALYFDGTLGPLTGVIRADYVQAGVPVVLEFWHGHGGRRHNFTLTPEHYDTLKRGERVTLSTDEVDSHQHLLFIDPTDLDYRVRGSTPLRIDLC